MSLKNNSNIVYELTRKQVKTQYRDSSLGFLWTVLNPLLNMLVMWVVFKEVLKINDPFYPLYLLAGNILFAAVRSSTSQALQSFVTNRNLLLRTKIHLQVFPLSNILTSIVNFLFSLIALVPFMLWLSIQQHVNLFSYQLIFILLMLPAFLLFEYGVGLFLAALFVFFRDIKHLYSVFLVLWNYATPVFWTVDRLEKTDFMYKVELFNPMFHFVNYFRDSVYRGATGIDAWKNNIGAYIPVWGTLGYLYLFGAIAFAIGLVFYKLMQKRIIIKI